MDELAHWRKAIREILEEHSRSKPSVGDIRVELICDEKIDHYELIYSGWTGSYRVHGAVIHIDIHDGKVWIQHDGTEDGVASRLVAAGIPKDKIVLGFKHPDIRPHTGFAVA